jgi:DNA polymerase-3 subunit delta
MQIKPEQFHSHLGRAALSPIYLISGDEPLQKIELTDALRRRARELGFEERIVFDVARDFDWNELARFAASLSLFVARRLLELRLGTSSSPGKEGGEALIEYCASPSPDNLLVITAARLDGRTKQARWYKALAAKGACVDVWPVDRQRLPGWIATRCRSRGKSIDDDAAELIAQRVEGNLLAAAQEVDKLVLLAGGDAITSLLAMQSVADSSRFDAFEMVLAAYAGDGARAIRMARGLRQEGTEVIAVLGAFMWELRRLSGMAHAISSGETPAGVMEKWRIWTNRRSATGAALHRIDAGAAARLIRRGAVIDRAAKGALKADPWQLLEALLLRCAGKARAPAAARS